MKSFEYFRVDKTLRKVVFTGEPRVTRHGGEYNINTHTESIGVHTEFKSRDVPSHKITQKTYRQVDSIYLSTPFRLFYLLTEKDVYAHDFKVQMFF